MARIHSQFYSILVTLIVTSVSVASQPNVVVVVSDDQGWGDLSLHGNSNLHTPRIDQLAADGARVEHFFVCPVCSPTRAELLTGRHHPRCGVFSTSSGGERLNLDEHTMAQSFSSAGYRTAAFGKWHNGTQPPYHPNSRGFDEFYGFCSGHWGNYFSPVLEHNGQLVRGNGFTTDDFTDKAIDFIHDSCTAEQPFFVLLAYNTPHSPMQVPDRWWNKFANKELNHFGTRKNAEDINHTRAALAMCENIDWNVGRLLDKLDTLAIAHNTIVVFLSDNGPNGDRWNGQMKGRKGSTDEGGVRSPLFVRWPARISPGTVVKQNSAVIDLFPTLAELADVPRGNSKPLDGQSLQRWLFEPDTPATDRILFSHWNGRISARTQRFRLDHQGQLFDMLADPGQTSDVANRFPHEVDRLTVAIQGWKQNVVPDRFGQDDRPFTIGDATAPRTQLPVRDATLTGNLKRSNRFPNCSFVTHWQQTTDQIRWDVDVLQAGRYRIQIYYSCAAADVGSRLQLKCGEAATLPFQISQPHDPPLMGAEHDRVVRAESYVKDFQPLEVGTMSLAAGRQTLLLQASQVAHQNVMDLRLIMLTRVDD